MGCANVCRTQIPDGKYIKMVKEDTADGAHRRTHASKAKETQSIISRQLIVRGGVIGLVLERANVFQCCHGE